MREWAEKTLNGMGASKYPRRIEADGKDPDKMVNALRAAARKNKWEVDIKKRQRSVVVRVVTKAKPVVKKPLSMSMRIKTIMDAMTPSSSYVFDAQSQTERESARRAVYIHNTNLEFSTVIENGALLIIRG